MVAQERSASDEPGLGAEPVGNSSERCFAVEDRRHANRQGADGEHLGKDHGAVGEIVDREAVHEEGEVRPGQHKGARSAATARKPMSPMLALRALPSWMNVAT